MAGNVIGHATLNVVPTTKGFGAALNGELAPFGNPSNPTNKDAGKGMGGGILAGLKGFIAPAMIAAGALAMGNFVMGTISAAGDLEQSVGAIDAVFKGAAPGMHTFAASASSAFGLTANEANNLATILGTQLKNGGTSLDDLGGKTQSLIGVGADLSAMFGGTTKEAVEALSSALKGERDPIEKFGVSLTQAKIDAQAAAMGFEKVGGSLSAEANQAATLALIMEQTADAHGAAARESGSLQSRQQQLSAGWENLQAKIGGAFLPVAAGAVGILADLVNGAGPLIDKIGPGLGSMFATVGPALGQLGAALMQLLPNLSPLGIAFQALAPVLPQIGALLAQIATVIAGNLTTAATALTPLITTIAGVFSDVLAAALPVVAQLFGALAPVIGQAAGIIAELVTVIAPLVTQVAEFLIPIIEALMPVVTVVFGAISDIIGGAMTLIQGVIDTVMSVIKGDWSGAWDGIQGILAGAWQMILGAVQGAINLVVEVFSGLLPAIGNALAGLAGWLWDTGVNLVAGLVDGIASMASLVWDTLVGIVEDAVGANVGQGLAGGLDDSNDLVSRAAAGLANATAAGFGDVDLQTRYGVVSASDSILNDAAARAGGTQYTTVYHDHSTSQEDKTAKLARAQDNLKASVAAGLWR